MAKFFDPKSTGEDGDDLRLHAPATARNRDILRDVLAAHLPKNGTLLEVASGTGEHAAFIAPALKPLSWQPTDIEPHHIASIDAWRESEKADNILAARYFNVSDPLSGLDWLPPDVSALAAINLIHIAPWSVTEALVEKAGALLPSDGVFFLYGPFKKNGVHTSASNEDFDHSLKARDPDWGVREMADVAALAEQNGFEFSEHIPMPANNFSLVFRKR